MKTKVAKKVGIVSMDTSKFYGIYTKAVGDQYTLIPFDQGKSHKFKVVQNHSPKAKCSYMLVLLDKLSYYNNKRISGLFFLHSTDHLVTYMGDFWNATYPFNEKFILTINFLTGVVTIKPMEWHQ